MAARLVQRTMQLQNPKAFSVIVVVVATVVVVAIVANVSFVVAVVVAVAVGGEILLATCLSSCAFQTQRTGQTDRQETEREGEKEWQEGKIDSQLVQAGKHTAENAMQQAEIHFSTENIQLPSGLSKENKRKCTKANRNKEENEKKINKISLRRFSLVVAVVVESRENRN